MCISPPHALLRMTMPSPESFYEGAAGEHKGEGPPLRYRHLDTSRIEGCQVTTLSRHEALSQHSDIHACRTCFFTFPEFSFQFSGSSSWVRMQSTEHILTICVRSVGVRSPKGLNAPPHTSMFARYSTMLDSTSSIVIGPPGVAPVDQSQKGQLASAESPPVPRRK